MYLNIGMVKCENCSSTNFLKKGFRKTDNRGKIQKYYCKNCHKFFTNDDGFYRMRNKPEIITMSIDMYVSNLSSRKMRNQLKRHLNHKVSHVSVLDWVRRYTLKVHKFIEKQGYNLGNNFYADETMINREGKLDRFWCCLDWDLWSEPLKLKGKKSTLKEKREYLTNLNQYLDGLEKEIKKYYLSILPPGFKS